MKKIVKRLKTTNKICTKGIKCDKFADGKNLRT